MLLITEKPSNYIGERDLAPKENKAVWYFDTQKKCLIYVFNDGQQAAYQLVGTAGLRSAPALSMGGLGLVRCSSS
jgi:hypothetical protein